MVTKEDCEREGKIFVGSHRLRDGTLVHSYCKKRDHPFGGHEGKKYSSYREIEEDLNMTSSDAQAWADVHQDRLKGDLKREVEEWKRMFD